MPMSGRHTGEVKKASTAQQLLSALVNELAGVADVQHETLASGVKAAHVEPPNDDALAISLLVVGDEVIMDVGAGSRWELPLTREGVAQARGLPPVWLTRGVWVNQAADAVA